MRAEEDLGPNRFPVASERWGCPPPGEWEPLAILAEGALTPERAKTAEGAIRYASGRVVAAIDSTRAPGDVGEHLGIGAGIPVVATLAEARALGARALLVGIAPRGGLLPAAWRPLLAEALAAGVNVASGLHTELARDPELAAAARAGGGSIWDLRRAPSELPLALGTRATGEEARMGRTRVALTVGTDCHVGKMTVSLELHLAALRRGRASAFVATGQTGIFIARWGVAVDRVPADFISGVVEELVRSASSGAELVWVEGQGAIYHPAYSGVALGLLHGALPDALILCHMAGRESIAGYATRIPSLCEVIRRHEDAASWVRPCRVAGLAIATRGLSDERARTLLAEISRETGLPAADALRFGAEPLLEAVEAVP